MTNLNNIVYAASGDGLENIAAVMRSALSENNIVDGRKVLLKPNMVDPSVKKACTSPEALRAAASVLKEFGASEILIGDEPAQYYIEENGYDFWRDFKSLGYDAIDGAKGLDLRTLGTSIYTFDRPNLLSKTWEQVDVPVRDLSDFVVVALGLPKQHGQYNVSLSIKNLMGLVPADSRIETFHKDILEIADTNKGTQEIFGFYAKLLDSLFSLYSDEPELKKVLKYVNQKFAAGVFSLDALTTHANHLINIGAMSGLRDFYMKQPGLYVIDGTKYMLAQEHLGELIETNFAAAGFDPFYVDRAVLPKIGISVNQVPYLHKISLHGTLDAEIKGDFGRRLEPVLVLNKKEMDGFYAVDEMPVPK